MMFPPIARHYRVVELQDGEFYEFGQQFPAYIRVYNDTDNDAEVFIADYSPDAGIPIKAKSSEFIMVLTQRLTVKGANVKVIGYFI